MKNPNVSEERRLYLELPLVSDFCMEKPPPSDSEPAYQKTYEVDFTISEIHEHIIIIQT